MKSHEIIESVIHRGGCHCGKVRFEIEAPPEIVAHDCNCSICSKSGFLHLIVPASRFRLLTDRNNLACYAFGSGIAKHWFCKTCGIKSFYVPRSNPDGYSINVRCLDEGTITKMTVEPFDGKNWEANASSLASLSNTA
ncbi:GFA family protein [Methylotuvimicrobium buryatense]|uniref:GFA family protein n=1 Tax=Methylotuvimicrobium buryatense TaxID=95641 RepID=A0A4P9UQ44_METBY|nr:GFA family protein [Methylotuvimicrobium buryatense]QCW83427.1 GFA family protein [Methylotuvimicrobium buryatense]